MKALSFLHTFLQQLYLLFALLLCSHVATNAQASDIDSLLKEAKAFHQQGIDFDRSNNPASAIDNYDRALAIRKKIYYEANDYREEVLIGIIKGYFNIGDSWGDLGNYEQMEIYLDSCKMIQDGFREKHNFESYFRRAQLYHALGQLYRTVSGMNQSLLAFKNAYTYYGLDKDSHWKKYDQAGVLNDISVLFIRWQVHPDSVLFYANKSLELYKSLIKVGKIDTNMLNKAIAGAKINRGYGYEMKGRYNAARASFSQALNELEAFSVLLKNEMRVEGDTYKTFYVSELGHLGRSINSGRNGLGVTLTDLSEFQEAEKLFTKGIQSNLWLQELNSEYHYASVLLSWNYQNLAEVYYKQKYYAKALEENQNALEVMVKDFPRFQVDFDNPNISDVTFFVYDDHSFLSALVGKTQCLQRLNKSKAALATATLGIDYIYQIRKNYQDIYSRNRLADFMKAFTEVIIQIHLQSPGQDIEKAFYYSEKNKIFTLLEAVRDHKSLEVAGVDKSLLKEEKELRRAIEKINSTLKEAQDATQKKELFSQLLQKKEDLAEVLDELSINPNYQRLFVSAEPVDIAYIQKSLLAKEQAMLEYFIGKDTTYIFLIPKRGNVQCFTVSILENELIKDVDNFINAILNSAEVNRSSTVNIDKIELEEQLLNTAYSLYRDFLLPIVATTDIKQLVIIPDGVFNKMPFSALVSSTSGVVPGAYHNYEFIGKQYAISYCYAATLLAEMQQPMWPKPTEVLAFAPSFQGGVSQYRMGLSRLRFNKLEVEKICEYLSCKKGPYLAESANKQTFMETVSQQPYYMLHLSTHGKADYSDPNNSYIAFSQLNEHEIDEKQFLFLRELYNMEIAVETVVLSSCETNLGPIHRAGGMLSLTRGFAFAGANSIISSLWEVNEESTKELMDLFYTNLRKGVNKSEALRLAKVSLLDNGDFNHPYYWAAFIPVGKTQDIGNGYERYKHLLLYGLGGLLVFFFIYRYRRFHALNH